MKNKKPFKAACLRLSLFLLISSVGLSACGSAPEAIAVPQYPEMAAYPQETGRGAEEEFEAWSESVSAQQRELEFSPELDSFYAAVLKSCLGYEGENALISPLNIYMSLSMLSEISSGETREEIMACLNCPDMEALRYRASELWNAHYRMDGATSLSLANSLWLSEGREYKPDTADILARSYYASVFSGEMGSEEYNALLQSWLSEETGGLLESSAEAEGFDENTALALASALCYKAKWLKPFNPSLTYEESFFGAKGEAQAGFMHSRFSGRYDFGEHFGASALELQNGGGTMYFILPDEGIGTGELINEPELMEYILHTDSWMNSSYVNINLSLPAFDIESQADLRTGLEELGIRKAFNPEEADFSSISSDEGVFLSEISHAVRMCLDEEGVSAAAYTLMPMAAAAAPPEEEIDFILNRPFIFILKSPSGQLLFSGIISDI